MSPATSATRTRELGGRLRHVALVVLCLAALVGTRASASLTAAGAPLAIYAINADGRGVPPMTNDAAAFNAQASVFGVATPPSGAFRANTSTFGGAANTNYDLTAPGAAPDGTVNLACTNFTFFNANGCMAAAGSTVNAINAFVAIQSWPFYVGSIGSSNVPPGTFVFETGTDDGVYTQLGPASFTYAQPGNFNGATGLTAGTSIVHTQTARGAVSSTGSFTIAATAQCATNLYWLTWEYIEIEGGQASFEYSWTPPGSLSRQAVPQTVAYGMVTRNGAPVANDLVSVVLPDGTTASVLTDSSGCYGYNYPAFAGTRTLNVTATDLGVSRTIGATLASGGAQRLDFPFPLRPALTLVKRITRVTTYGPTPGPTTSPQTVVPTPDPSNPAGVGGTTSFGPGVYPRDTIEYTIYFFNGGSAAASGPGGGPTYSDVLQNALSFGNVQAFTCCINPTSTATATFSATNQTLQWSSGTPLPPYVPSSSSAYQGTVTFKAIVH